MEPAAKTQIRKRADCDSHNAPDAAMENSQNNYFTPCKQFPAFSFWQVPARTTGEEKGQRPTCGIYILRLDLEQTDLLHAAIAL